MLDLSDDQLSLVKQILFTHLNDEAEVYVFGSRAKNTARKYSDLDLLLKAASPLDYGSMGLLEEAFSDSDLPFKTDLLDWHRISEEFKDHIDAQLIRII